MARTAGRLTLLGLAAALVLSLTPSADAATLTARQLLGRIPVAAEAGSTTYDRAQFPHWIDADRDGCNTRKEVLIAESRVRVSLGSGCGIRSGRWYSWYDGRTWTNPSDVDIDHVVALKEAWESGARRWSLRERRLFANDLGFAHSLIAVTDNVNMAKSAYDPAEWLPPLASARCAYAITWVQVKYRWRLTIDSRERSRLASLLARNCGDRRTIVPARAR